MAGRVLIVEVLLLALTLVSLIIAMSTNGNARVNIEFKMDNPLEVYFGLKHTEIEYGLEDASFSTKYDDVNVTQMIIDVFDPQKVGDEITKQLDKMTANYKKLVKDDIMATIPDGVEKEKALQALEEVQPKYKEHIDSVTNDIDFSDSLNIGSEVDDGFKFLGIPAIIMFCVAGLFVVCIVIVILIYYNYFPGGEGFKCIAGCCIFLPSFVLLFVLGGIWIFLGLVMDEIKEHVDINQGTEELRQSIRDNMQKYYTNLVQNYEKVGGVPEDTYNFSKELDDFLKDFAKIDWTYKTLVSPYFCVASALLFLIFMFTFCCCNLKRKETETVSSVPKLAGDTSNQTDV